MLAPARATALFSLSLAGLVACGAQVEDDGRRAEPMRTRADQTGASSGLTSAAAGSQGSDTNPDTDTDAGAKAKDRGKDPDAPPALAAPPVRDPAIAETLDRVRHSGLRFYVPSDVAEEAPDEYTAEQFAKFLETKSDWLAYDIVTLDAWITAVATSSFVDRVAYEVALGDGQRALVAAWLRNPSAPLGSPPSPPASAPTP